MGRRIFSWLFFFLANALYHTLCSINGCLSGRGEALESVRNNNFFYKRKKKKHLSPPALILRGWEKSAFLSLYLFFSPPTLKIKGGPGPRMTLLGKSRSRWFFFFFTCTKWVYLQLTFTSLASQPILVSLEPHQRLRH